MKYSKNFKDFFKIRFIGRLPDVTRYRQNTLLAFYTRMVLNYFDKRKHKFRFTGKPTFVFNRMGDQYVILDYYVTTNKERLTYFLLDTNGALDEAPEYFLKSFDDHLALFPRKSIVVAK